MTVPPRLCSQCGGHLPSNASTASIYSATLCDEPPARCLLPVMHVFAPVRSRFVQDSADDAMRGLMTTVVALLELAPGKQMEAGELLSTASR